MTRMSAPLKDRPDLAELLTKARAAVESMTPEEKRLMHAIQRKSWVVGEMMLEHPEMTREEAEKIYEAVI